ncbi:DHH family phosphoesterase [Ferrimonas pelagia]|uniref:DHH family phosphoesterase n=1 Tax=Ferrimonas pelagia TaxID=1177826 RepID=A0ABP9ECW3_9GAMM
MAFFDVFNGDADGIIALLQLRLAEPRDSVLVTGVKRDIQLLDRVEAGAGDEVTVLDISMEKNQQGLRRLLAAGAKVRYVDHHRSGDIPESDNLRATIDLNPNTCTSVLVDKALRGKYRHWAITAAFGDNMLATAEKLAAKTQLTVHDIEQLQEFGTLINYNGYGRSVDDLHFPPEDLYKALLPYTNPLDAINDAGSPFDVLKGAYDYDMAQARAVQPELSDEVCALYLLPNAAWARRVSGSLGNALAYRAPDRAHAVLTLNEDMTYTVSVRAPIHNKQGADVVCSGFATGGGRAAAAGINALPADKIEALYRALSDYYRQF